MTGPPLYFLKCGSQSHLVGLSVGSMDYQAATALAIVEIAVLISEIHSDTLLDFPSNHLSAVVSAQGVDYSYATLSVLEEIRSDLVEIGAPYDIPEPFVTEVYFYCIHLLSEIIARIEDTQLAMSRILRNGFI